MFIKNVRKNNTNVNYCRSVVNNLFEQEDKIFY